MQWGFLLEDATSLDDSESPIVFLLFQKLVFQVF